jgi:hypothetical protein
VKLAAFLEPSSSLKGQQNMTYEKAIAIIRKPGHHSVRNVCLACDAILSSKVEGIEHQANVRRATTLSWAQYESRMIERALGVNVPSNWEWRNGEFRPPLQAPDNKPLGYSNASLCQL